MHQLKNDRLLKAIRHEPVDQTPIWIMRQAGRYLPEYRATRSKAGSFLNLCKTPELACEVTLQPLKRFDLDAAIIFSDILTIPDAMGLGLNFAEGRGPFFTKRLQNVRDIEALRVPDSAELEYVYQAIRLTKAELTVPLIGFCGSPWTLAAYMLQGHSEPGFPLATELLAKEPQVLHKLLDVLAKSVAAHLKNQIAAGADVVMIFDTWGGLLPTQAYEAFSLFYNKRIITELNQHYNNTKVPVILFTKGGSKWLSQITDSGCAVVGLDWEISLKVARQQVGAKVALQGNLNPSYLRSSAKEIQQEVLSILSAFGHGSGHIFNLGHGITPDVPPENVKVLVDAVHEMSQSYHYQDQGQE